MSSSRDCQRLAHSLLGGVRDGELERHNVNVEKKGT
jgi:hypothetical protein